MCHNFIKFSQAFFIVFLVIIGETNADVKVTAFPEIAVDKSSINLFSTPLAYYQGTIYTVNVEPAVSSLNLGFNLRTIVRKAVPLDSLQWRWDSHAIDDNTIEDKYHTQASIAVDKQGYIHVAYGMHNMPWQYVVSNQPRDVTSFSFFGDAISTVDKIAVKVFNKTSFPSQGTAAIPGNQITYPAFFYDVNNDLYITYRFAVKPKRKFNERVFSAGIALYDVTTKKWSSLGGEVLLDQNDADWSGTEKTSVIKAFALRSQWAVYLPRLAFDKENGMHVSWLWREGGAGKDTSHPSYAYSPDNDVSFYTSFHDKYSMPISVGKADWIGAPNIDKYDAITEISVDDNYVYVVSHRVGKTRELSKLNRQQGKWLKNEGMPYSASNFRIDESGGQWAFATGLTVLYRKSEFEKWKVVYQENEKKYGYPKVLQVKGKNEFYVHTQSLDGQWVKIYKLEF